MITKLDDIFVALKDSPKRRLIAVWAVDSHTIEAVDKAIDLGFVEGVLVGDKAKIQQVCNEEAIDINKFTIVQADSDIEASVKSVELIAEDKGDILLKGFVSTDKLMRVFLNKQYGLLQPKSVMAHISVIQNEAYHKLLIIGDAGLIPEPDFKQKIVISKSLVKTANLLNIDTPKLAVLSATEQVLQNVQASIDACVLSKMGQRGQLGKVYVDGPLSLDLALDKESVKAKGVKSEVAGDADCLLFPSLDAGNIFYKANTKLSKAVLGTYVLGAKVPCILASRADSTMSKLYSIGLSALYVNSK